MDDGGTMFQVPQTNPSVWYSAMFVPARDVDAHAMFSSPLETAIDGELLVGPMTVAGFLQWFVA